MPRQRRTAHRCLAGICFATELSGLWLVKPFSRKPKRAPHRGEQVHKWPLARNGQPPSGKACAGIFLAADANWPAVNGSLDFVYSENVLLLISGPYVPPEVASLHGGRVVRNGLEDFFVNREMAIVSFGAHLHLPIFPAYMALVGGPHSQKPFGSLGAL
ncbi:hypothetical protein D918_02485 [Trichuris suis]|nr:hypothetical protein D918_02485 [Trichuris suis]